MATKKTTAKSTKSTPATRKAKRAAAIASNADHIVTSKHTSDGAYVYIEAGDGRSFTRLRSGDTKEFRALSGVGKPYAAVLAYHKANPVKKPQARLANGVDARTAPQSAAAVAAQRKGAQAAPATGKGKARMEKAAKAKQPARGGNRRYKLGTRKDESKPDTFRKYMLTTIMSHKDTDSAKAAHAKSRKYPTHKLDFNWSAQQGYIVFVD